MLDALERDLHIDVKEKSRKRILDTFRLAKSLQLPVLENDRVVGILDLYDFLGWNGPVNLTEIMEQNIVVAGKEKQVFSFKRNKQQILPFVDDQENYIGFINKVYHKCYLPSKEYLQVIEKNLHEISGEEADVDYEQLADDFHAIFESNYDGLYITVEKGRTLSVNREAMLVGGITQEDMVGDGLGGVVSLAPEKENNHPVTLSQILQNKREISMSDELFADSGIIRIVNDEGNLEAVRGIKGFEKIRSELAETQKLKEKYQDELRFLRWSESASGALIAESPAMKKVISLALRVAKVDSTVLVEGPSGAGKGILSRLIHDHSTRKEEPFIKIDCGVIPETLMESELFGYEKGAFTGAEREGKRGLVELADKGTLFLDEIGEFPCTLQAKLLRLLQDREIVRVGGKESISLDIRVIAATNRDLEEMVRSKQFRKDLYYRLNVVPIRLSPLQERKEDIRPLIEYYLQHFNQKYRLEKKIDRAALKTLLDYSWPGNVRELENLIEYLVVTTPSDQIFLDELPDNVKEGSFGSIRSLAPEITGMSLKETMDYVERKLMIETMRSCKSTEEMALALQVDRSTIVRKLQKHALKTHFEK